MTDQEMVAEMTRHADLCRDIRPDWATLFLAAAERIRVLGEALDKWAGDMHYGSRRPCDTCKRASEALGRSVGCVEYAEILAARAATDAARRG